MTQPALAERSGAAAAPVPLRSGRTARSGRRRALVALLLLAPVVLSLSAALGAAVALEQSRQDAAARLASGDYAGALSEYRELAARTGPLYALDPQAVEGARRGEDRTLLLWAPALARGGQVEQALNLLERVQHTKGAGSARDGLRAELLLDGARAAARSGDPMAALRRLNALGAEHPSAGIAAEAARLRPGYELASVSLLLRRGSPAEAVAALDRARAVGHSAAQDRQLRQLLPAALLAAARLAERRDDHAQAATDLARLVGDAPTSSEARTARELLGAPVPVTGTLSRRDGSAVAGAVRLAGHFVRSDHGDFATGPFFTTLAGGTGDFRFGGVPPGGTYVLQVQRGGDWLTPVDTASGDAAYPVTATPLAPVDLAFVIVPS